MSGTTETFTYDFTGPDGAVDSLTVTVDSTPSDTTGFGPSLAVTEIVGSIDGTTFTDAISNGGTTVNDGSYIYDNAIFPDTTGADGASGSVDGLDNYGLDFTVNGVEYNLFSQGGVLQLLDGNPQTGGAVSHVFTDAPCFCAGTMIATAAGDAGVETLAVGDLVLTTEGTLRPVLWIGRRAVATRFADPISAMPVRIRAGALADNVPVRDMLLSPCHALLVDGVLAQAGALVNGTSIVRETAMPETFTYYHIELADHSLILADGAPAETFIDNIDRMAFDNWEEHAALVGNAADITEMALPRAKSARQVPAATRARLAARAVTEIAAAA